MSDFLKSHGQYGPVRPPRLPVFQEASPQFRRLAQSLAQSQGIRLPQSHLLEGPDRAEPRRALRRVLDQYETTGRYDHVVFAKGMNDSQFALNPIVTLNHDYTCPPTGRSLWRKFVKDGDTRNVKAKTVYPPMPASWPAGEC